MPDFTYRALLVDAAGTLLIPSEPAAEVVPVPLLILATVSVARLAYEQIAHRCTSATAKSMV